MRIASLELSGHHVRGGAKPRKTTPMPGMANHKSLLPTGLGARRPVLEDSLLNDKGDGNSEDPMGMIQNRRRHSLRGRLVARRFMIIIKCAIKKHWFMVYNILYIGINEKMCTRGVILCCCTLG